MDQTIIIGIIFTLCIYSSVVIFIGDNLRSVRSKTLALIIFGSFGGGLLYFFSPFISNKYDWPYIGHIIPMSLSLLPVLTSFIYLCLRFYTREKSVFLNRGYLKVLALVLIYLIIAGVIILAEVHYDGVRKKEWQAQALNEYNKALKAYWMDPEKATTVPCMIDAIDFVLIENEHQTLIDVEMPVHVMYLGYDNTINTSGNYILRKDEFIKFGFDPIHNEKDYTLGKNLYSMRGNTIFDIPKEGENIGNAECFVIIAPENNPPLSSVIVKNVLIEKNKKIDFESWIKNEMRRLRDNTL